MQGATGTKVGGALRFFAHARVSVVTMKERARRDWPANQARHASAGLACCLCHHAHQEGGVGIH